MKRALLILLCVCGVVCLALPFHIQPTGVCLLGLAFSLWLQGRLKRKTLRAALAVLTALCAAVVLGVSGWILAQGRDHLGSEKPDAVIVLGAQIYGDAPSRTLHERLTRAAAYCAAHPGCTVIVCGGRGADEARTEASVMKSWLIAHGVSEESIFTEEQSHNTRENLLNAAALAARTGIDVSHPLIITSDFHLCRAEYLARTLGMTPSGLVSCTTPVILRLNYAVREAFAFVKALWQSGDLTFPFAAATIA